MATLDAAAIELANTLAVEAVPAKLRCGSCNKLAINAVKLPCCDQSICEPCSQDLPESCPICGHSPLSAADCKPNKSLRMTVKAFIKSEEKKRSRGAEVAAPLEILAPPVQEPAADFANGGVDVPVDSGFSRLEAASDEVLKSVEMSPTLQDSAAADQVEREGDQQYDDEEDDDDDDDVVITTERPEEEDRGDSKNDQQVEPEHNEQSMNQFQMNGEQDFGFGSNQQGFGNMDLNSMSFNPMMAMQNGMGMGNFPMGMPNMLGMPGMNMDPSMMFGNGSGNGFGGMTMNDMNMMNMAMGMGGMGGFGGNMMGMNGPQPGFFPGQGGYNHQNFGSQMNQSFPNRGYGRPYGRGGYGRGRGGFGYNRGARSGWQNHPHQFPDQQQYSNQQPQQQQNSAGSAENMNDNAHTGGRRASPSYEPMKSADGTVGDSNVVSRQDTDAAGDVTTNDVGNNVVNANHAQDRDVPNGTANEDAQRDTHEAREVTIDSQPDTSHRNGPSEGQIEPGQEGFNSMNNSGDSVSQYQPFQQNYTYGGPRSGGFAGRGGFRGGRGNAAYGYVATAVGEPEITPSAPPINAPTGPKAMRAGLPNSGIYSRSQPPPTQSLSTHSRSESRPHSRRESVPDVEKASKVDHEVRERTKSRSRSRSRQRERHSRQQSPRNKHEYDETYERRKDREKGRSHRDRDRRNHEDEQANDDRSRTKGRSRSETPDENHANGRDRGESHSTRSHRRDRHRHRDRSRSPDRNETSDSSRRKNKSDRRREDDSDKYDRSRDRDRARDRRDSSRETSKRHDESHRSRDSSRRPRNSSPRGEGRKRDRDRDRHRERDHDREHDRESERTTKKAVLEQPEDDIGFKIKGGSRKQTSDDRSMRPPPPTGPKRRDRSGRQPSTQEEPPSSAAASSETGDSYAAERQAREQARMERHRSQLAQSSRSNSLGKRSNREDEEVEIPTGPKGYSDSNTSSRRGKKARPMSYKYEDEIHESRDERDSKRWR